jgi:hypothetical protein
MGLRPKRSARKPQVMVPTKSPRNKAAMKLAIPVVPNKPVVVAVRMPSLTNPGAMYPVKSRSYSSKKKPRLKIAINFHTAWLPGSRSRRAEMLPASTERSSASATDAP